MADEFVPRDGADLTAALHQMVILRAGERHALGGPDDLETDAE
jgi:hypothetical protein